MATTVYCSDPREAHDGRAEASWRIALRLELAEMLRRLVPELVTVYPGGDPDLLSADADDAASDLLRELDARGYRIAREART